MVPNSGALASDDHLSWTYGDDPEDRRVLTAFVAAGIAGGARVASFAPDDGADRLLAPLAEDVDRLVADGQLVAGPAEDACLPGGVTGPGGTTVPLAVGVGD